MPEKNEYNISEAQLKNVAKKASHFSFLSLCRMFAQQPIYDGLHGQEVWML